MPESNPKLDPHPGSNTEKPPDEWVSGDDPMTGAQASYLKTLCEEAKVEPTRISFVYALSLVCREWQRATAPRAAIGNIPRDLATLRLNLKRLVLPPRRPNRSFPRAVKIKMSNYARKRPAQGAAK